MECSFSSSSHDEKGKDCKKKAYIKSENSRPIHYQDHNIISKNSKHDSNKFDNKNSNDIQHHFRQSNHQHHHMVHFEKNGTNLENQKMKLNYKESNIYEGNCSEYELDNSINIQKIDVTDYGSQPIPCIFNFDKESFFENSQNCKRRHSINIDNFSIHLPNKNTSSCTMCKNINPSIVPLKHPKIIPYHQSIFDDYNSFNSQNYNRSSNNKFNEKKVMNSSIPIDSREKNYMLLNTQNTSSSKFNEKSIKLDDMTSTLINRIPQVGYYRIERTRSFNNHILTQNIQSDNKKRKIQIYKSNSIPEFKLQPVMAAYSNIKKSQNKKIELTGNENKSSCILNKKADRYGWFIPENVVLTPQELKIRQIESSIELKREQKWIKMIKNWNYFISNKQYKIKSRIKKGIPDCFRSKVWQLLLDPEASSQNQDLKNKRPSIQSYILIGRSKCCKTIEADLHRTMPHVKMFCDEPAINSLRNILHAYSNKDPEIGYYQGMAFLAAILLIYLDEVQAFWCFVNLMNGQQLKFRRLFIHKFSGLDELNTLWEKLLILKFPKVSHNLNEENIKPILYTPSWFLCSYLSLPFEPILKLRIFDRTLMFGARTLLSFGLTIIALNKKLLENEKAAKILIYLQHPDEHEAFKNWRSVISKFDELWLSQSDYDKLFRIANIPKFF